MPIKAICFDLWETLITNTPEISRARKRLRLDRMGSILAAHAHHAEAAQIESAYRTAKKRCHELYWSEDLDIPCRRQIEIFLEELGIDAGAFDDVTIEKLEHVYANAAVELLPGIIPGARKVIADVRSRGFRTGLISNTGRTPGYALREILACLGLAPMLDAMVFSNEHGQCKPKPSIFDELRRALGVAYDQMVFVGDSLYADVLGAKRCGMRAVHFVPFTRGTAVAPHVDHEHVEPDATISRLEELPAVLDSLASHD